MLRRRGFRGSIVMLSSDAAAPVDRPNLSKDYLAGSAPEDWIPLSPDSFYDEAGIELRLNTEVTGIDTKMIAQQPEIAKARDRRSDGDIKLIRGIGSLCRIQRLNAKVDFRKLESNGFDVEIESQLGQFLSASGVTRLFRRLGEPKIRDGVGRIRGCPSWTLIEPCASRRSLILGEFWKTFGRCS
jgi:NADPH-dependent 2,4-dienoyl-CoA reductase/sulfur reductase-like enzyme